MWRWRWIRRRKIIFKNLREVKKKSVIMASNFEEGISKIQKKIASGVRELLFISNRLAIFSNVVQNLSKKTPALPTL